MTKFNPKTHIRRNKPCRKCGADHWLKSSPSSCIPCRRGYNKKNATTIKQKARNWYRDNKERASDNNQRWRQENKETQALYHKKQDAQHYEANKSDIRVQQNGYQKSDKGKVAFAEATRRRRAAKLGAEGGGFTNAEFEWVKENYGHRCLCCNKKKPLHADHVIPLSKGGRDHIDNIQPLCQSCNSSKGTKSTDFR